jgi:hypothetical protein
MPVVAVSKLGASGSLALAFSAVEEVDDDGGSRTMVEGTCAGAVAKDSSAAVALPG